MYFTTNWLGDSLVFCFLQIILSFNKFAHPCIIVPLYYLVFVLTSLITLYVQYI